MLYQIYETQRSFMEPFADFALAASKLYSNPVSPFGQNPFAQRISAAYDLMYRLGKDYEKPEFGIQTVKVGGTEVAIHERVEVDKPFCELRRFKRFSDDPATLARLKQQPAVLVVAPLSGHYATLLRDTVRTMLQDHKVYITDWRNARTVPLEQGEFHLDDYVNYVQDFIRHLQREYGNCHVMSVCQPTVPVLAAVSLMASRGETTPLTMTMMGGPIDARKSPTAVNNLAMNKSFDWFENNVIYRVPTSFPGAGRRVYPGFLQHAGFVAMNPDRHLTSHYDYFKHLIAGDDASAEAHRQFYDEYNAVLDMDADYYLETIRTVFQEYRLVHGTWDVRSPEGKLERVRPQDIRTTAHFTIEGELDDISGSGQTEAAHGLCHNVPRERQKHLEVKGAGHYGIFSGRRWREVVYPQVRDFILQFNGPAAGARKAGRKVAAARRAPAQARTSAPARARGR
jgi:poly(3-hydroxybutyrate) depolymerase